MAMVTLINIDGSSPRPVGSQIGVACNGQSIGMITGGCAEKAIVAEALACLKNRTNKIIRYGEGSPYLDIVLPCGSGIDLFIETKNAKEIVKAAHIAMKARKTTHLQINQETLSSTIIEKPDSATKQFTKRFEPIFRLAVFGEGTNLITFSVIAKAAGYKVDTYSNDHDALLYLKDHDIDGIKINHNTDFSNFAFDAFTGVITLFHEHEWETAILHAALNSPAAYIGALGSRHTHATRLALLNKLPPSTQSVSCISGPIGLDIGAQTPHEIAISILAEITARRRHKAS